MHVVYISREYPPTLRGGGIASYVRDMASALVALGHKVTVICASDDTRVGSDIHNGNLRIIRLSGGDFVIPAVESANLWRKLRSVTRFFSYRKKVRNVLKDIKDADIVEVPEFGAESYALHGLKLPIVIRLHTPALLDRNTFGMRRFSLSKVHEWLCAIMEKREVQRINHITSCSQSLADWVSHYFHADKAKITTIYNPVRGEEWEGDINMIRKCDTVLFVGTVAQEKGVGDLVEACNLLRERGRNVELTIAGKQGQFGLMLQQDTQRKGYDWCTFLGNVPREQLKAIYANHLVACFPSLWDNMPIVCLEAMSAGCVVMASSSGGMGEIISDGKDGFLCPPGDAQALSEKLEQALSLSEAARKDMMCAARDKVRRKFDMSCVVESMLNYYQSVINK